MALSCSPYPLVQLHLPLKQLIPPARSRITPRSPFPCRIKLYFRYHCQTMASSSGTEASEIFRVPDIDSREMEQIADQTFQQYGSSSSSAPRRNGQGTAIFWFRNDLRVLDNEPLLEAWRNSQFVLPVYCVDPRLFGSTHYFGFPKIGALRAQFIIECLDDLRRNLVKRGLNLLIKHGKPEEILPAIADEWGAHTVYAQKETCSEEVNIERLMSKALQQVLLSSSSFSSASASFSSATPKLRLVWGSTMYHINDLPFSASNLPDVYTQFRKSVESKSTIRTCLKTPISLGPLPSIGDWGCIPTTDQLGVHSDKVRKGMSFSGGESAALSRVREYFWKKDLLKVYKSTRNGMLGADYSTKFSVWLATGCLSPRFIYEEVKRYEKERQANDSTYWSFLCLSPSLKLSLSICTAL